MQLHVQVCSLVVTHIEHALTVELLYYVAALLNMLLAVPIYEQNICAKDLPSPYAFIPQNLTSPSIS